MATRPPLIPWDSGLVNISAVTAGHQTSGIATNEIPASSEENTWKNNTYLQFLYLLSNVGTQTRNRFPTILGTFTGWAYNISGTLVSPAMTNTTTGVLTYDLDIPQGYKLSQIKFALVSTTVSPGGTLVAALLKAGTQSGAGTPPTIGSLTVANGSFPLVATDQTMNFLASSSGLTVTVAAGAGTYTRSAGSYLTDGFFVGQVVQWAGFVNGGNNAQKTITALSATVMTVSTTGLVNETGGAGLESVAGVSPTVDDTFGLQFSLTQTQGGGSGVSTGMLRCTYIPQ